MLAQSATSVAAALERTSPAAIDWKLDGARVQIHRQSADIRVFTRSLDDITSRVPELVEMAQSLEVHSLVLDGEVLALREDRAAAPVPGQRQSVRQSAGRSNGCARRCHSRRTSSTSCTWTART